VDQQNLVLSKYVTQAVYSTRIAGVEWRIYMTAEPGGSAIAYILAIDDGPTIYAAFGKNIW